MTQVPALMELAREHALPGEAESPLMAEIILEGLVQHLKLSRQDLDSTVTYKEMLKFQLLRPQRPSGENVPL